MLAIKAGRLILDRAQDLGTIEAGKLADIVLLDTDPLPNIRVLQNTASIRRVIKGGRTVVARE